LHKGMFVYSESRTGAAAQSHWGLL